MSVGAEADESPEFMLQPKSKTNVPLRNDPDVSEKKGIRLSSSCAITSLNLNECVHKVWRGRESPAGEVGDGGGGSLSTIKESQKVTRQDSKLRTCAEMSLVGKFGGRGLQAPLFKALFHCS